MNITQRIIFRNIKQTIIF